MAERDLSHGGGGNNNGAGTAYGVLGVLAKALAPKVGPIPAALLLFGVIGAVAVVAARVLSGNAAILFALLGLLALLAGLTVVDHWVGPRPAVKQPQASGETRPINAQAAAWITTAMTETTASVADALGMPRERVRSNLFEECPDGYMRMCREVALRMTASELTLRMPVGYGATGKAAQAMRPRVRVGSPRLDHHGDPIPGRRVWDEAELEETEVHKPHKDLAWIMSAPVTKLGKSWVLNIDGLEPRPKSSLEPLLPSVMTCASIIATTL